MIGEQPSLTFDGHTVRLAGQHAQSVPNYEIGGANNAFADPTEALGAQNSSWVSLGPGGWIVLGFGAGRKITNGTGEDLVVYEAEVPDSLESSLALMRGSLSVTAESFRVSISDDAAGPWVILGDGEGTYGFDLETAGVDSATYVKIEDLGGGDPSARAPGFDLDAIEVLDQSLTENTPGTGDRLSNANIYGYPNPFNPEQGQVTFRYSLARSGVVTITIFDTSGKEVTSLDCGTESAGEELRCEWDGKDDDNTCVANGVYFYVIETSSGERAVGKLAVLR
jgi:hypothetical protein